MARQKSVIKLQGQMGGISFYKSQQDGYLAREKGGVDAQRIQTDPNFERTRENGAEFGRAGAAGKLLRTSLRALLLNVADSRMTSRLTAQMVKVVQADATNPRGQRNVIDGETELLIDFEFNANATLNGTFFAPYTATIDRAAGTAVVDVPPFVPVQMLAAPQGATHYKLVSQAAEVDFENNVFVASDFETAELPFDANATVEVLMNTVVTPASTHPIFLVLGIEFLQLVNGVYYSLKNGAYNPLSVVEVDSGV